MNEKMSADTNALNWFEIPVKDISRAKIFYEKTFEIKMFEMEMMGMKYAMFPSASAKVVEKRASTWGPARRKARTSARANQA